MIRWTSRALSVAFGWGVGIWASHHDSTWFGYGKSSAATGGDPLALIIALAVMVVLWKGGDALTK